MENQTASVNPSSSGERVLFTEKAISGSTILGGPLAGTYLIAHNFNTLGNEAYARRTWLVGVLAALIVVPFLILLPEKVFPESVSRLFHLLWAIPAYLVVRRFQLADIERHLLSGGKKGSSWKAAGIGLLWMLPVAAYGFAFILLMPIINTPDIPKFRAGLVQGEYSKCKLFYDSSCVSMSDAKVAGAILEDVGYFHRLMPEREAHYYLKNGQHIIALTVDEDVFSNPGIQQTLQNAANELRHAYGNRSYLFRLFSVGPTGVQGEKSIASQ